MPNIHQNMASQTMVGDPAIFAVAYAFIGEGRTTELGMYVGGQNILGFTRYGEHLTTRWPYLGDLVAWLRRFAITMREDPYPVDVAGEFAVEKDEAARDFECDDEDEEDAYYVLLADWLWEHSWIHERGGAILSNVIFEYKDGMVELSWDNRFPEDGVSFDCEFGGARVDADVFRSVVLDFAHAFESHWGVELGG